MNLDPQTSVLLANLALELNATLLKVKIIEERIFEINDFVNKNGLKNNFFQIAQDNNYKNIIDLFNNKDINLLDKARLLKRINK